MGLGLSPEKKNNFFGLKWRVLLKYERHFYCMHCNADNLILEI